jgi:serine phosphatase RsbU (regulator of sigma subunit)
MAPEDLAVGAATRPYPGETANGDGWQVDWHLGACRLAVLDGLGHGPQAAAATDAALKTLGTRPDLSPGDALTACHTALLSTRGAAMSVATIDSAGQLLQYAGVGNVDAHLLRSGRQERLVAYRGIVGGTLPTVRTFSFDLGAEWLLVVHTDGIRSRFQLEDLGVELQADPQKLADAILASWSRETDDATVVIIRPKP